MAAKNNREASIDTAAKAGSVIGIDDLINLLNSPKRLGWMRFYSGLMAGAGGVIGAAIILLLLGLAVKHLGGVPWIGDLLHQISDAAHAH